MERSIIACRSPNDRLAALSEPVRRAYTQAMDSGPRLRTQRLLLRRWQERDLRPLAAINADPQVMEHFPSTLTMGETQALIARIEACFAKRGYGLWAVEVRADASLAGFVGLWPVEAGLPFAPAVEVGWRLARSHWSRGYATEAASAAVAFGFDRLGLREIVSLTARDNARSRSLMERLGMWRDPREDFEHPLLPPGSPLRAHVLYRLSSEAWREATSRSCECVKK